MIEFQSTPPVKAATMLTSLHLSTPAFQSTPPVKAATQMLPSLAFCADISIHAAREGGDKKHSCPIWLYGISIHAAREGGDTYLTLCITFL